MDRIALAGELKALLKNKFPGNYNFTPLLASLLGIHEKTVLTKLRGATPFTFEEVYKIADELDIPVSEIFNKTEREEKHPMEIYINHFSIHGENPKVLRQTLNTYRLAVSSPNSKYFVATNTLPDLVFANHEQIGRFNYMKWLYFNRGKEATIFSKIELSRENREA
ncbi:MAG: hypothetical protein LUD68_10455 [Rikenellaceae bacterium]|nr:hypothetical protein [Rikenellaceae bacterium]